MPTASEYDQQQRTEHIGDQRGVRVSWLGQRNVRKILFSADRGLVSFDGTHKAAVDDNELRTLPESFGSWVVADEKAAYNMIMMLKDKDLAGPYAFMSILNGFPPPFGLPVITRMMDERYWAPRGTGLVKWGKITKVGASGYQLCRELVDRASSGPTSAFDTQVMTDKYQRLHSRLLRSAISPVYAYQVACSIQETSRAYRAVDPGRVTEQSLLGEAFRATVSRIAGRGSFAIVSSAHDQVKCKVGDTLQFCHLSSRQFLDATVRSIRYEGGSLNLFCNTRQPNIPPTGEPLVATKDIFDIPIGLGSGVKADRSTMLRRAVPIDVLLAGSPEES